MVRAIPHLLASTEVVSHFHRYSVFAGEAHIGLTRFYKGNKARAVPESSARKLLQQPKSIGLSKRMLSNVSKASSDTDGSEANLQPSASQLSHPQPAIGDGQSYVNPQLLRHLPNPQETTGTPLTFLWLFRACYETLLLTDVAVLFLNQKPRRVLCQLLRYQQDQLLVR